MNLSQLKYFKTVCDFGKVSAAAEYLHISQPSVSNSIKELEREFGIILFKRHHGGMQLTNEGMCFLKHANDLLLRAEQIEHIMCNMGNDRKILRLGIPPMIGAIILPHIYREFNILYPDITLEITEGGRNELYEKLNGDYLDMIFIPHSNYIDNNLSSLHISRLELVCCMHKNNALSSKKEITPYDLKNAPVALFNDSFFQTKQIKKWFEEGNIIPHIIIHTGQLSTIQSLVSNNTAIGFMFEKLIDSNSNIIHVPIRNAIYTDISLVWKKEAYMLACMKSFKSYIAKSNIFKY